MDIKAFDGILVDDLDEQTKRELLIGGISAGPPRPEPKCRWCKGTGKVKLLTSEQDCDCVSRDPEQA